MVIDNYGDVLSKGVDHWNSWRKYDDAQINLSDFDLTGTPFLKGINLSDSLLVETNFGECNLSDSLINRSNCFRANFKGANLSSVNFWNSNLGSADFERSNMRMANLFGASLSGAKMSGADLQETELKGVEFHRANVKSIVQYSGRGGSRLITATDFSNSTNLTQEQVNEMVGDSGTILPKGLVRPPHWIILSEHQSNDEDDDAVDKLRSDAKIIASRINKAPIEVSLAIASIYILISDEKERVRGENPANDQELSEKDRLLDLFNLIEDRMHSIMERLPNNEEPIIEQDADDLASIINNYRAEISNWLDKNRAEVVDNSTRIALIVATTTVFSVFGLPMIGTAIGTVGFFGSKAPEVLKAIRGGS